MGGIGPPPPPTAQVWKNAGTKALSGLHSVEWTGLEPFSQFILIGHNISHDTANGGGNAYELGEAGNYAFPTAIFDDLNSDDMKMHGALFDPSSAIKWMASQIIEGGGITNVLDMRSSISPPTALRMSVDAAGDDYTGGTATLLYLPAVV